MAKVRTPPTYFSSHAVARMLRVSPTTVLAWIDRGLVTAHRTPGGHRRVERGELLRFLRDSHLPIPPELAPVATLLLVDDDLTFLRSLERELKQRAPDLEVYTASDAVEALLLVGTARPQAVLLDAYMPGMNGVEVCRRLREAPATRGLLVLAVTGSPSPELAAEFLRAGAAACFAKPVDVAELLGRLGLGPADDP